MRGRGRMGPIRDGHLRRAPDPEWVRMYRLGLSRQRIAALADISPVSVGYHLILARRQDPGLEADHGAPATPVPTPRSGISPAWNRSSPGP